MDLLSELEDTCFSKLNGRQKIALSISVLSTNTILALAAKPFGHFLLNNRPYPEPFDRQLKYAAVNTLASVAGLAIAVAITLCAFAIRGYPENETQSTDTQLTKSLKLTGAIYLLTEATNLASAAAVAYWRSNEFNAKHDDDDFNSAKMSDLWNDFALGFTIICTASTLLLASSILLYSHFKKKTSDQAVNRADSRSAPNPWETPDYVPPQFEITQSSR